MTTIYIVGSGAGSFRPASTVSATVEVWGAGQCGNTSTGAGGSGAGYSRLNAFSLTAGTPQAFLLGTPGMTTGVVGGDTWFSTSGTVIANGGGSGTSRVGDTTFAGGAGGSSSNGTGGGGGSGGPNGTGQTGGNGTGAGGGGGGGNGGGTSGGASPTPVNNGNGGTGGNGFAGTGGAGGLSTPTAGSAGGAGAGGGGGGASSTGPTTTSGGAGGDDYDNGGGGSGGCGGLLAINTASPGTGGTPGGGGSASFGNGGYPSFGGFGLIRITYSGSDSNLIIALGLIVAVKVPPSWLSGQVQIDGWGAGGGGATGASGTGASGGGGGAFSHINSFSVSPGGYIYTTIGNGGAATIAGNDTVVWPSIRRWARGFSTGFFGTTTLSSVPLLARGGAAGSGITSALGGASSTGTGDVKFSGGASGASAAAAASVGGGGGGSGGADGIGTAGSAGTITQTTGAGGRGDASTGGAGGAAAGAVNTAGNPGVADMRGGGGGSGSGGSSTAKLGGAGAWPGGGGGGGGGGAASNTGGAGADGALIITQLFTVFQDYRFAEAYTATSLRDLAMPLAASANTMVIMADIVQPIAWSSAAVTTEAVPEMNGGATQIDWRQPLGYGNAITSFWDINLPLYIGATASPVYASPFGSASVEAIDQVLPLGNSVAEMIDYTQPVAWSAALRGSDTVSALSIGSAERIDIPFAIANYATVQVDLSQPVMVGASAAYNINSPISYGANSFITLASSISNSSAVQADEVFPVLYVSSIFTIFSDWVSPLMWGSVETRDVTLPTALYSAVVVNQEIPVSTIGLIQTNWTMPVYGTAGEYTSSIYSLSELATSQTDTVAPESYLAESSRETYFPTFYTSTILPIAVTYNSAISWSARIRYDIHIPAPGIRGWPFWRRVVFDPGRRVIAPGTYITYIYGEQIFIPTRGDGEDK